MSNSLDASVRKYDPDFTSYSTIQGGDEWVDFDRKAIGDWTGSRPKPSPQDLLVATDKSFTTVAHWYRHGEEIGLDYLQMRSKVEAALGKQGGFSSISNAERRICARLFLLEKMERFLLFPSIEEQIELSREYHEKSMEARISRFQQMEMLVFSEVLDKGYLVLVDQMGDDLITAYKRYGVLGFVEGDRVLGILDYVFCTPSTRFDAAGLRKSGIECARITLDQLALAIAGILSGAD